VLPWSSPITSTGKSALVPPGPWIYGMTGIGALYSVEPASLRGIVPRPLEPTGRVFMYIVEIISQSTRDPELSYQFPDLLQYNEAAFFVEVSLGGEHYAYCPFMYVDTDLALLRGYVVGFPKKIARITYTKIHPLLHGEPGPGLRLVGFVARSLYLLIKLGVEIGGGEVKDMPLLRRLLLLRYFPAMGEGLSGVEELVNLNADIKVNGWRGVGRLEVMDSPNDELSPLSPTGDVEGYYFHMLFKPVGLYKVVPSEPPSFH